MVEQEFVESLPEKTQCNHCHRPIPALDWGIGQYRPGQWMGVCIVRCRGCSWTKVAAAGSTEEAHLEAQRMRKRLMDLSAH